MCSYGGHLSQTTEAWKLETFQDSYLLVHKRRLFFRKQIAKHQTGKYKYSHGTAEHILKYIRKCLALLKRQDWAGYNDQICEETEIDPEKTQILGLNLY